MTTTYLICGGRDFADRALFEGAMRDLILHPEDCVIVHGAARGADTLADGWARARSIAVYACPADWEAHGKAAGWIRNQDMLEQFKPDVVIAFPGGRGTADMVKRARKAGVVVVEVKGG